MSISFQTYNLSSEVLEPEIYYFKTPIIMEKVCYFLRIHFVHIFKLKEKKVFRLKNFCCTNHYLWVVVSFLSPIDIFHKFRKLCLIIHKSSIYVFRKIGCSYLVFSVFCVGSTKLSECKVGNKMLSL